MEFRLSHGDDVNFAFGFRVADRHDGRAKKASGIETLLAIVIAGIFHRESRPVEHLLGVREIKAVLFQVGRPLGRLPREFHEHYYTYDNIYFKWLTTILKWPWILQPPTSPMRRQIDLLFQRAGLATPEERIETANLLATTSLIAGTHMLAVVPVEVAQQFAAKGMLRVLAIDFDCGLGNYGIATSEAQLLSPACSRFIEVLREEAHRLAQAPPGRRGIQRPTRVHLN
jgi:hypothetical protein